MRKLIIAWVVTLGSFVGVIVWLQLSYEPEPVVDAGPDEAAIAEAESTPAEERPDFAEEDPGPMPTLGSAPEPAPTIEAAATTETASETQGGLLDDAAELPNSTGQMGDGASGGSLFSPTTGGGGELLEEGPYGPIPVTSGGRQPWRVYAREYDSFRNNPRVAIIISGLGLNQRTTENALNSLPADVTLAFSPYGQNLPAWAEEAREGGHELLVMLPMEPLDYPVNDPGPHSLLTSLSPSENIDKLHYVMSRFQNYVGLVNDMGSRFTASEASLRPLMADLQRRGVLFVDARTTSATIVPDIARAYGVPSVSNSRYIDNVAAGSEIDRYLLELEELARARGSAVGIGRSYPVTIARVTAWSKTLAERGIDLVPITAIIRP